MMFALTDAVSIAIVTQIGALLLAGLAAFVSWRTRAAVNSRMDEFKSLFAQAKINEGILKEKAVAAEIKGAVAEEILKSVKSDEKDTPA